MRRCRVIAEWQAAYADPIVLEAEEQVWLSGESDEWDGHVWVWARNQANKEGWIPDTLVKDAAGKSYAKAAFSARELSCSPGDALLVVDETHGWVLCRTVDGSEGWVPARNLAVAWD